jgi:predicted LPLAT superfamily acyltransferase
MPDKPNWNRRDEKGAYLGLRITVFLLNHLGSTLSAGLVHVVIAYYFFTSRSWHRASREYLDRVSRTPKGLKALHGKVTNRTVYQHLVSFGFSIVDKFASWQGNIPIDSFHQYNRELFDQRIVDGSGGIWIISHLGNMEACQAVFHECHDVPVTALVHTKHAEKFNRLIRDLNPENQVELLQVSDFDVQMALTLREKISRGEFIFIAGDRTPVSSTHRVVEVPFLGENAPFPYGPFLLAYLLKCPVGSIFCLKTDGGFDLMFHDLPDLGGVSRHDRDNAIKQAVTNFAAHLEAYCQLYPLQWFNFFDFWGKDMLPERNVSHQRADADFGPSGKTRE